MPIIINRRLTVLRLQEFTLASFLSLNGHRLRGQAKRDPGACLFLKSDQMIGILFFDLMRNVVGQGLARVGFEYGKEIGELARVVVLVIVLIMMVRQLGLDTALVNTNLQIFLGTAGVAVALARGSAPVG
jgi:hypothetical protein